MPKKANKSTGSGRRKPVAASAAVPKDRRNDKVARRKNPPKRRVVKEKREDMKIIASASQSDIYTWALSMALMVAVLSAFIMCAIIGGSN